MPCSFLSGCRLFIPIFDIPYDSYDELKGYSLWTFDAILAVAGKIKNSNKPPCPLLYKPLDKAQGIARFSPFGPVVLKKARGKLSLVNIVGDVDGLSKGMLLIGSEKIAYISIWSDLQALPCLSWAWHII
jgi:hypothetical protein